MANWAKAELGLDAVALGLGKLIRFRISKCGLMSFRLGAFFFFANCFVFGCFLWRFFVTKSRVGLRGWVCFGLLFGFSVRIECRWKLKKEKKASEVIVEA